MAPLSVILHIQEVRTEQVTFWVKMNDMYQIKLVIKLVSSFFYQKGILY